MAVAAIVVIAALILLVGWDTWEDPGSHEE